MDQSALRSPPTRVTAHQALDLLDGGVPFAVIRREGADMLDVLVGSIATIQSLDEVPTRADRGAGLDVLCVIPFRQVRERGFTAHDDGTPLLCLSVESHVLVPVEEFASECPELPLSLSDVAYDLDDEAYAEVVRRIVRDEIGEGEGANFVIRRTLKGQIDNWSTDQCLSVFRRLLARESGAYWTFCVNTGDRVLIGASPERHISSSDGLVTMNPISGTFRIPRGDMSPADMRSALEGFLQDEKEVLELMMVVDEELKMMSALCPDGGRIAGPFLKPMRHLVHTEYVLTGESNMEPLDLLRGSMFAATVVGSPVENACRIIASYEAEGRGYYGSVLALIGSSETGRATLDAPILIRTADIASDGRLRVSVGATLVRDSVPEEEVEETRSKLAGLLGALGLDEGVPDDAPRMDISELVPADSPLLVSRNARLSPFWMDASPALTVHDELVGRSVRLISAEDDFANMLAHLLRSLGITVLQQAWRDVRDTDEFPEDYLLVGPGPGDPRAKGSPRLDTARSLIRARLHSGRPLVAVCLGHQLLASELGLRLDRKKVVVQGAQEEVDLFGQRVRAGFYNTFTALVPDAGQECPFEYSAEGDEVVALRGPGFSSLQFHAESILTPEGRDVLAQTLVSAALPRDGGAHATCGRR